MTCCFGVNQPLSPDILESFIDPCNRTHDILTTLISINIPPANCVVTSTVKSLYRVTWYSITLFTTTTCWELFHLIPFPYNAYWLQQQQLGCSNTKLWNQWCMLLWTVLTVFVLLEGHRRCSNVHWLIRILCLLCCYLRGSFAPHPLTPSVFFQDSITLYPPAHHTRLPRIHVVDIASLAWGLSLPTWGVRQYRTTFLDLWVAEGEV